MDKPLVVQTEPYEPEAIAWLSERCRIEFCPPTERDRLAALLAQASGLIVRTYTRVDGALLDLAPRLKVVGRAGVALENVDVPACRARGVEVVHTPGANTRAVVELVTAFMLDALRPRVFLDQAVPPQRWHELREELTGDRQVSDLTLGIWGFGRIGSAMARVAAALDMRALYHEIREIPESGRFGARPVSLDEMLASSDIVTVHVDYRPSNEKIVSASTLSRLKPRAVLINTSRGFVVDPSAVAAWARANPGTQAIIDVHDPHEPIAADYPLLGIENVHLTPHLGSGTRTAKTNMSWVVRDVWAVISGQTPEFPAPRLA